MAAKLRAAEADVLAYLTLSQKSMARVLHPEGPPLLTNPLTGGIAA